MKLFVPRASFRVPETVPGGRCVSCRAPDQALAQARR